VPYLSTAKNQADMALQEYTGTSSSKLGGPIFGLEYYYPSTEKIRQVYPVWCSRLHNHTLFIKKNYVKSWGSVQILGSSGPPNPPVLAPMVIHGCITCSKVTISIPQFITFISRTQHHVFVRLVHKDKNFNIVRVVQFVSSAYRA